MTAPLQDAITRGQEASLRLDLIRAAGLIEARHNEMQKRGRGEGEP